MSDYKTIFENNRRWVAENIDKDADFLAKLSKDQTPDYLYIGCSDSRVPANEIMGLGAGEVFVHRNIANVVVSTDLNVQSVINYAVDVLKVKHVVVCGHTNCGGVKAAMTQKDMGILNPWLRHIRDVYRLHHQELNAIGNEHERYNRLIELNVQEQCFNIIKTAVVQKSYLQNGYPEVHGWVFSLESGIIKDLEIDFPAKLKEIQEIYDLSGGMYGK